MEVQLPLFMASQSAGMADGRGWKTPRNTRSLWMCRGIGLRAAAPTVLGYGDVRVMVDVWSPDGKTNLRFGDVWFTEQYAIPNQYHREGEAQELGALGHGIYAAYRTGQEFAEL